MALSHHCKHSLPLTPIYFNIYCRYYFIGRVGLAKYVNGDPWQKIGLVFATFNSIANPFVYTMLMPVYRKSLMATFGCEKIKKKLQNSSEAPNLASAKQTAKTIA